jgi:hypothetical protein
VDRVQLCLRSWYGHPEHEVIHANYMASKVNVAPDGRLEPLTDADGGMVPLSWTSGLRCWNLLDHEGLMVGRVYEPTAETPFWIWTDDRGDREIAQPITVERLTVLMVEYRLLGGVDA